MTRRTAEARALCDLFPNYQQTRGVYLYALGLEDGRTKIGITQRPRERIVTHMRECGSRIVWTHLFGRSYRYHSAAARVERVACGLASAFGERQGKFGEWFESLNKERAIDCVRKAAALSAPAEQGA